MKNIVKGKCEEMLEILDWMERIEDANSLVFVGLNKGLV